jgi:RNA polymerase sigma-B factor
MSLNMTPSAVQTRTSLDEDRSAATNRMLLEAQGAAPAERKRLVDEVITLNIEVARSVAGRYRNRGIPTEDLEQVACLALIRAAHRFDPTKADDFLTYAVPTIRGEVKRHFRDHGWVVRPPRRVQEVQALIRQADAGPDDARSDNPDGLAARLGIDVKDVSEALQAHGCFAPTSLDAPNPVGEPWSASLVDDDFAEHEAVEARAILRTLTKELAPRERLILYLRFVEGRTQKEIGEEIGVTQMQVSRLLTGILTGMRSRMEDPSASAQVA